MAGKDLEGYSVAVEIEDMYLITKQNNIRY